MQAVDYLGPATNQLVSSLMWSSWFLEAGDPTNNLAPANDMLQNTAITLKWIFQHGWLNIYIYIKSAQYLSHH